MLLLSVDWLKWAWEILNFDDEMIKGKVEGFKLAKDSMKAVHDVIQDGN